MLCYIILWGGKRGKGKLVTARKPAPLVQGGATKLNSHFIFIFRDSFRLILIVIPGCYGRGGGGGGVGGLVRYNWGGEGGRGHHVNHVTFELVKQFLRHNSTNIERI
jgi:hypothetical protein